MVDSFCVIKWDSFVLFRRVVPKLQTWSGSGVISTFDFVSIAALRPSKNKNSRQKNGRPRQELSGRENCELEPVQNRYVYAFAIPPLTHRDQENSARDSD